MVDRGVRGFDPARLRAVREMRRNQARTVGEWTQGDVAERLGMLRVNYLAWEQGRRVPSPAALVRLSALLDVEPSELTNVDPAEATLADMRQWAGLTQADVARRLGVSRSQYAAIERSERSASAAHLATLAQLLGRSLDEVATATQRAADSSPS